MKKLIIGFVTVTGAALTLVQHSAAPKSVYIKVPYRAPAQSAQTVFDEVVSYYRQFVNTNPQASIVATSAEAIQELIRQHQASEVKDGAMVLINNVGPSDSDFKDKSQIERLAKTEILEKAAELAKAGGGTIVIAAGNTNTGVGRFVTAAQDPEFVKQVWNQYKVRIATAGISSAAAALSHGDKIEINGKTLGGYSKYFMNTQLDVSVQIPRPEGDWTVKNATGVSAVVEFTKEFYRQTKAKGISSTNLFVLREGGPIGITEGIQMLFEIQRLAAEEGVSLNELSKNNIIKIQQGHQSGTAINELAADKGPRAATDLLLSLYQIARNNPEFKANLEKTGIQLEHLSKDGVITFKSKLDFKVLETTVAKIMSDNPKLMADAAAYNKSLKSGVSAEEVNANLGIMNNKDLGALKGTLKAADKNSAEYSDLMAKLLKHQAGVRVRALADTMKVLLQEASDLSKGYGNRIKESATNGRDSRALIETQKSIDSLISGTTERAGLQVSEGKVERAIVSDVAAKIKDAIKK